MSLENPHIEINGDAMVALSITSAKQLGAIASCILMGASNREERRELRHSIGETLLKAYKFGDEISPPFEVHMPMDRFEVFSKHIGEELAKTKRIPGPIGSLLRGVDSAITMIREEHAALLEKS